MTSRRGEPWTDVEDAELRRLIKAGTAIAVIAAALGRSARAIPLRVERLQRPRKLKLAELTPDDKALFLSAEFDEEGWVLPLAQRTRLRRLERGQMVEKREGRWYLRPPAFRARLWQARNDRSGA